MARSEAQPKPLVEVGGLTLIQRQVRCCLRAGLTDFAFTLGGPASELIAAHLVGLDELQGCTVELLRETHPLGTIGGVQPLAGRGRRLLVTNADLLSEMDLEQMREEHARHGAVLTIATHEEFHQLQFGEVLTDGDGQVTGYLEKPRKSYRISSGTYVLEPAVVAWIAPGEPLGIPELTQRCLERGTSVREHRHSAEWLDVNDADALARARAWVSQGRAERNALGVER